MDELEKTPATPEQPPKKIKVWQIVLASAACLVLLLSLSVVMWWSIAGVKSFDEGWQLVTNLFTPRENDVYYKDSYTASEKKLLKNRNKTVGTIASKALTNGQLQIYYWVNVYDYLENNGYYAFYQGLDYAKPFDEQTCPDLNGGTWQHYFLQDALGSWHKYQALAIKAEQEGMELPEDLRKTLDNLRATMSETALDYGHSSLDAMIQADMGPGCTFDDYKAYMEVYFAGYAYFNSCYEKIDVSDASIEQYFAEHEDELTEAGFGKDSGKYFRVRHILIDVEGGTEGSDGQITYTDAEWEACREQAQKLLDQWLEGEHTEATFAQLAKEHTADTGSASDGGLYDDLDENTNFVQEFKDWYLDESRQVGDYGLVKSVYGYHIMYFSGMEDKWIVESRDAIYSEEANKVLTAVVEEFPMEVNYKEILLGEVDMNK